MSSAAASAPLRRLLAPPVAPPKWYTLLAVCIGLGMLMVDTFVVNVALPTIARDLDAGLGTVEWVVSGYTLTLGVLPIAMGRLGDILGRRTLFLAGLALFVLASALCGAAWNIESLLAFRVLQGAGAAVMMPLTLSIVTHAFPARQRGLAIGVWGGVSGLGLIAGPLLGGLLVRGDSWRWIFTINVPISLAGLLLALRFVPQSRDDSAPRSVDWPGVALLSGALLAVMLGITRASEAGWTSPLVLGLFAAGTLLFPLFVAVERHRCAPLIDLNLFRSGTFVMACLNAFLFSAAVFGSQPFTSLFMQNYWGFSPLEGGLAFLPATAIVATLMPFSGILGQKLGTRLRLIIIAGSLTVVASALPLLFVTTHSTYQRDFLPAFVLRGTGIGLVMSALSLAVMSAVPVAKSGLASGTLTMSRNVGTAIGVAVFGALFTHHLHATLPDRIAAAPVAEQAHVLAAAEHFVPAGDPVLRAAAEQAIVDGFVMLSAAVALMAGGAALAALFIHHRPVTRSLPEPEEAPAPPPAPLVPEGTT